MEITRETVIGDIVDFDPETAEVFIDCPVSRMESIEEACEVHGVDPDELIENLKDYFEHKNDNK